jgi:hypothetical protein
LLVAGREAGLLLKVYLALKTLEDHLRHQAVESSSRFGRWVAGVGASAISFIAGLFAPSEGVEQNTGATHAKIRRRSAGIEIHTLENLSSRPTEVELTGRKGISEAHLTTAKEETVTEIIHRSSLELDAARRKEKQEKKEGSLARDQEKDALTAVQEQQLLALAQIDGIAGPEVFAILDGLRQPYASVAAVRDGIALTNEADEKILRRRFEEFFACVKLATV